MKYQELTFSAALTALKHQWKLLTLTIIAFALLGSGAGVLYANRLAAPSAGNADSLPAVEFPVLGDDTDYYNACYKTLLRSYQNSVAYLQSFSEDKTLSEHQKMQLDAYMVELEEFYKDVLSPVGKVLQRPDAVYIPASMIEEAIEEYKSELSHVEQNIVVSELAVELIKSMDAPRFESDAIVGVYGTILNQASNYGVYLNAKETYERKLDLLENQRSLVLANARALEHQEKNAQKTLDELAARISQTAEEFSEANHLCISTNFDDTGMISMTITHTHSASTAQEVFALLMLLCVLVGICCGMFLAVVREAGFKKGKKGQITDSRV